jgi:lysophospholipase L1-like esterase
LLRFHPERKSSTAPDTVREYSLEYEPAVYSRSLLKPVDRLVEVDSAKAWGGKGPDEPSEVAVFISSNGYRGPEFAVRKPPEITRIIVLGGSSVFDHGVADGDANEAVSWPHLLGKALAKKGLKNIEVINAGIPGHATGDSLGRLYAQLWTYSPDYVLVYHGWNDIKFWKSRPISPEKPLIAQLEPYDAAFISYRGFWGRALSNSQIYAKARTRYYQSTLNVGSEGILGTSNEMATDYDDYGPEQFRLNLELIVAASNAIGATPVLVTQATLVATGKSPADRDRINYGYQNLQHDTLVRVYEETYDIIRDVGSRTGAGAERQ